MNCIQVKIYPNHTVHMRRNGKCINIHPQSLWIYLGKSFYIKTYQDKKFAE